MNFLKRCWQKRWLRRLTWTALTLVTLCALFCAWVNWSGARQWRATQAMLKAEGETLDFRATMNEPIPESENFCAIPLLKDLALVVDNDAKKGEPAEKRKRLDALKLPLNGKGSARPKLANPALGKRTNFKAWADWLRKEGSLPMPADSGDAARDVLAALAKHDAIVQELTAGLARPRAQWTPEWKTRELPPLLLSVALPHYTLVQGLHRTLALRATAALRIGDAAKAHETALIIARLDEACLNDPFVIGLLVGVSGTSMLHGVTWELCASHAGTAEDFAKLESALVNLDFHRATLHAWRGEAAVNVGTVQGIKIRRDDIFGLILQMSGSNGDPNSTTGELLMRALPGGLFDASSAVLADLQFRYLIKPLKQPGWQQALASGEDLERETSRMKCEMWTHPSYIMSSLIAPGLGNVINNVIYAQTLVNQAVIACALERHHIENGSYPDSLNAVKLADGKALPPDLMDGKPMRYRKTPDGKYALWSIGFDGKDDGGKRTLDEKKPEDTRFYNATYVGDWVWDFPESVK